MPIWLRKEFRQYNVISIEYLAKNTLLLCGKVPVFTAMRSWLGKKNKLISSGDQKRCIPYITEHRAPGTQNTRDIGIFSSDTSEATSWDYLLCP